MQVNKKLFMADNFVSPRGAIECLQLPELFLGEV